MQSRLRRRAGRIAAAGAWLVLGSVVGLAQADTPDADWKQAGRRTRDGAEWAVYVEARATPGRPAFRIETAFEAPPHVAAATLMEEMSETAGTTPGERRKLLERSERGALVHTFVDLPFLFSDRELVLRIEHSDDVQTGVHRVAWSEVNDLLPPPDKGVLRLRAEGYWEFRPSGGGTTQATYMSRAEVGGSLPTALGDRLMRRQAEEAVTRLRRLLDARRRPSVAAPPPVGATMVSE